MIGFVSDLIRIVTPIFYVSVIFSPYLFKDLLFRKEKIKGNDDNVVYIKMIKKSSNPFLDDVENVMVMNKNVKNVFNLSKKGDIDALVDHILDLLNQKYYFLTYTDKTYISLKYILRNHLSIDKKTIKHINFCDAYSYTYKENIPLWKKTIVDYKNIFEFILCENNNDLELLHTISR